MVREEDAQPLAQPHTPAPQTVLSSARGRGREKTNEILNLERGEKETKERERDRGGGFSWVWWHKPVILSTHEAKAGDYKFKAHLATGSSRPT
jgi:hypothetical protein